MINKPVKFAPPLDDKKIIALDNFLSSVGRDAIRSASGTYTGDGKANRTLNVGFSPQFIIIQRFLGDKDSITSFAPTSSLIFNYTVTGSAVTSITTNGIVTLDGLAHGGYDFEFIVVNPTAGTLNYSLYVNNDQTATNYNRAEFFGGSAGPGGAVGNNAILIGGLLAGQRAAITGTISLTPDGYFIVNAQSAYSQQLLYLSGIWKIAAVTNITRLDLVASAAGGIGVNSRFRMWKKIVPVNPVVTDNMLFATADNPGVSYVPSLGYIKNGVTGFTPNGVTLGNGPDVNAETKTYTYLAIG